MPVRSLSRGMSQCSQEGSDVLRLGFLGLRPRSRHLGKDFLTEPGPEAGVGHDGEKLWQQMEQ